MKKTNCLIILFCIILLNSWVATAQYCTPTYVNSCTSDDIINSFTIASINNTSSGCNGQVDNYQNTGMSTALKQGNTYTFTVQSGSFLQGFGIWIDYNQDSTFDDTSEFVWASTVATVALITDSFTIPVSAPTGLTRMRVRSVYDIVPVDTDYCSLHNWGETEDYDIIISSPSDPPIASFISDIQKTCDGVIAFTDLSGNDPTSWLWDFGDGNTDSTQNPSNTYSSPGTYTVVLICTNTNGSDTSTQSNYIEKITPDTIDYSEDFESGTEGNFVLVDNSESFAFVFADGANTSSFGLILCGNSSASWANPVAGAEFTTNPTHNASATLCFDASSASSLALVFDYKMIFQYQDYYTNFRITVNGVPATSTYQTSGATTNWAMEMVDLSAYVGGTVEIAFETSCKYVHNNGGVGIGNGVYIDNIQLMELKDPPTTAFSADLSKASICEGDVTFTDNSLFSPTSWLWDFGDGNASSDQNPIHTYTVRGTYDVTLIATNANGNDTLIQTKLIEILDAQPLAFNQNFELGTSSLDDFVPTTNSESNVLVNDTAANSSSFGLILAGNSATAWINPAVGDEFTSNPDHFSSAKVCVDASALSTLMLNFDYKLVYQYQNFYTNFRITVNGIQIDSLFQPFGATTAWKNKTLDLTSFAGGLVEIAFEANCKYNYDNNGLDIGNAVYIDNVLIKKVDNAPITSFTADVTNTCEGVVSFADNSLFSPTSWLWDFGDGTTDTTQNPTYTYSSAGLYTITLTTTNINGNDTLQKVDYINVMSSQLLEYLQDFEIGGTTINDFVVVSNLQSNVMISDTAANSSSFGLILAGNSNISWTNPVAGDEFTTNPDHFASATLCIDATSATSLALIFDYKLLYQFQDYYTNFRVMVNGIQFGNIYQTAGTTTGWNTEILDLSAYSGGRVEVAFETNCKYNHANGGSDIGNGVYIDNILIKEIDDPPVAGISSNVVFSCDGIVNFQDASSFNPTSWLWDFGDGVTDTAQNPTHTYTKDSVYTVGLTVSSFFGNDTTIIKDYITVEIGSFKCDSFFMPATGDTTFTDCNGLLLDNGGDGDYLNNSDVIITIAPAGTTITNVVITFQSFDFEAGFDYIYIYDGPDTSSTLVGQYDGTSLPEGGRWTSTGPYVTLRHTSDGVVTGAGFVMEWNCVDAASPPYASFVADNVSSCDGLVTFTDNSIPSPTNWLWDFGDGQTDTSQNPTHQYSGVGSYNITFIVSNKYGADTTTIVNYINVVGAGSLPYFQSFDVDSTTNDFIIITGNESNVDVVSNIGASNTPAIVLDGNSASGWVNPAAGKEFLVNPDHFSSATICTNDTSMSTLLLIFDYKLIHQYQDFYTNFRVTVNGDQIGDIYQPAGGTSNWTKAVLDISSYTGSQLEIAFEANCKYSYNNGGNDVGNAVYIDSIFVKEVDVPPVSAFISLSQFTCDGVISFVDQTIYVPNTWLWDF
ncbi:MAG: PKD domain-containing protein, partial [Bacteroidia bacterium]|nr:PKD domain-containing protein [Bacteroidia bacterium]